MTMLNSKFAFSAESIFCAKDQISKIQSQYIFIGEDHRDYKSKKFIVDYLPVLKFIGFDTIFVEYIESYDQKTLDLYNTNPVAYRERTFRTYGLPGDWGYSPTDYLLLTDAVGFYDFDIYGLDRRSDLRFNIDENMKMAIRDQHMFNLAKKFILENPFKKIIFFNGSSHSFVNTKLSKPSFYQLFKTHFREATTTNIKIDYFNYDSLTRERIRISSVKPKAVCPGDYILFSPLLKNDFDFYLFENTTDFLPTIDYPTSMPI